MSLARTGKVPSSFPSEALSREGVRRKPMRGPRPGGLSSPRWLFGSPPEKRACCAGRIPGGDALPGSEPPRSPPADLRRFRFSWKQGRPLQPRRRGNPGRCCSAVWMRAPPGEPRPGIRGRCAAFPPLTAEYSPPAFGPSLIRIWLLLAADRNGEPLPPLRAPSGNDLPARRSRHAAAKSVGSQAPPVVRLVGAFHSGALLPRYLHASLEKR
jgi:hypothetical protein